MVSGRWSEGNMAAAAEFLQGGNIGLLPTGQERGILEWRVGRQYFGHHMPFALDWGGV